MIRSTTPASSKWIAVPGDLRIAWNGVDANALVDLSWYAMAARRVGATLSGTADMLRIGTSLMAASIVRKLRQPYRNIRPVRSRLQLTLFAQGTRQPKQWRMAAGMSLQRRMVHFECIFATDRHSGVFC